MRRKRTRRDNCPPGSKPPLCDPSEEDEVGKCPGGKDGDVGDVGDEGDEGREGKEGDEGDEENEGDEGNEGNEGDEGDEGVPHISLSCY